MVAVVVAVVVAAQHILQLVRVVEVATSDTSRVVELLYVLVSTCPSPAQTANAAMAVASILCHVFDVSV